MKKMRTKVAAVATVFALALSSLGPVAAKAAGGKETTPGLAEQIHEASEKAGKKVSVKMTDIPADEVAADCGYATLNIYKYYGTEEDPQYYSFTALANQEGELVFPYKCSRKCQYAVIDDVISFSQVYPGHIREYTYDGEEEYCRYYDLDKNELFDSKLQTTTYYSKGMISSPNAVYDGKGNLIYEIPADLQKASVWNEGSDTFPKLNGYPEIKCDYEYNMVRLSFPNEENLIPFESAITMKDKLEAPDLPL